VATSQFDTLEECEAALLAEQRTTEVLRARLASWEQNYRWLQHWVAQAGCRTCWAGKVAEGATCWVPPLEAKAVTNGGSA
jgi:hypothetical protein